MVINNVLAALIDKIDLYTPTHVKVQLNNIATLREHDTPVEAASAIILSIVNIEEDKTLKNQSLYKKYEEGSTTIDRFHKPAQNLVFSLLFSSYDKDNTKYIDGLMRLEEVIRYLQDENVFYYYPDGSFVTTPPSTDEEKEEAIKIILDMTSLKTEQVNQLWSYLGSRYMPSVLYSMRMIHIQKDDVMKPKVIRKGELKLDNSKTQQEIERKVLFDKNV